MKIIVWDITYRLNRLVKKTKDLITLYKVVTPPPNNLAKNQAPKTKTEQ